MLISRTPYRVSFFGGGTDYPAWSSREGGAVLSTSIDKYCYITCRFMPPFFESRHKVVWSHIERVDTIGEILHPAVREGLRYMAFDDSQGFEIHHYGDLPARAGMGSSSAFAVGLINVLSALREKLLSKEELAAKAIELERERLKENVGCQDQVASAHGGLNRILFETDGSIRVEPVKLERQRRLDLESRLLLVYAGTSRLSSEIAGKILENLPAKEGTLRRMRRMVDEAADILVKGGDLDRFGELLDEGWRRKREMAPQVTSPVIDGLYETARKSGALGGKLLGAGGTGFMVFYVAPERQAAVREALRHYLHVPFRFEETGSVILYGMPSSLDRRCRA